MDRILITVMFCLTMAMGTLSHADIYKYVNENGVTIFTNIPDDNDAKKVISEGTSRTARNIRDSNYYNDIIYSKSDKYNLEPSLIKAVITAESNWRPTAVSTKGAIGLMQLMPSTASDMLVNNPYDPEENIEGGAKYLRYLLDIFNGDLTLALAAYNAGPERVRKFGNVPPIPETKQYVKRVLSMYEGKTRYGSASASYASSPETIYKVVYDNGTVLYTNTPQPKPAKF
ncbi:MAG: lytic transglycosylase domain-containing protein [Nitrospirae bacterium]|nr:lytic transglycosylase domain-containing protein [Nitrospirota bacterium]